MAGELTGLGRRHVPDERDREHLLAKPRRKELAELPRRKMWSAAGVLDQGATSQCVAYSSTKWLTSGPICNKLPFASITDFYNECQRNDEWPGEGYDGTSVRAAFKVLKGKGLVDSYKWAFELEPAVLHVITTGPMVFGTDWYAGMMAVDRWGYIEPEGENVGGHAYCAVGVDRDRKHPLTGRQGAFRIVNSWGQNWGQGGRCWLSFFDAAKLIEAQGEACTAVEARVG